MQMALGEASGALVIELRETRLDAAVAIRFKDAIRSATSHPGTPVILDLNKVEFMDSSGLGAIVGAMKLLGPERPLEIAALSPGVRKVFRLTRMDTVFRIHDRSPETQTLPATG
ncbi:MAG: anti-sigma factor antagonist [Alphaproteobacteria bacterium]|nr:anti-sigma factor antagonist [Alphaproteobacteria bacterium]